MYTIGEFSNLCMVTTKTLRHYDNIGLLRPAHISGETGYRYYEVSQFRDMFFILKCKDYGFTLDEISSLLHAEAHVVAAGFAAKYTEQGTILTRHQELMRKMREMCRRDSGRTDGMQRAGAGIAGAGCRCV